MKAELTKHANVRVAQRGLSKHDIDLALSIGTITADGVYVRKADINSAIANLKKTIRRIEKLNGLYIAMPGKTVITAYYPSGKRGNRLLRENYRSR